MESILILGSGGMLGGEFARLFPHAMAWDRQRCDVINFEDLRSKIKSLSPQPQVIINCIAFNDVDGSEEKKEIAFKLNAEVPGELAKICKELQIPLVHFSTNYIFDGVVGEYSENSEPHPLSVYAESKYQGELSVQKNTDVFYIIRTAVLFGQKGESGFSKKSFIDLMLDLSLKTDTIKVVEDESNSITYVKDLAERVIYMLENNLPSGVYHVTNAGVASWYELAQEIFTIAHKPVTLVPVSAAEFPRKAVRPGKSILLNSKLPPVRAWQEALREFLKDTYGF